MEDNENKKIKKISSVELKSYLEEVSRLAANKSVDNKKRLLVLLDEILTREEATLGNSKLAMTLRNIVSRSNFKLINLDIDTKVVYQEHDLLDLDDMVISEKNREILARFFKEQKYRNTIRDNGLPVSHKIYLYGPPGNGKTSLAGGIAKKLDIPLFVVKLSGIIESYLGSTSRNINNLFEQLKDMDCVLLLDELESLLFSRNQLQKDSAGKENINIVSSLLQSIDKLPENVILLTATNNEELIDHAVRRRFNYEMNIEKINNEGREKYIELFSKKYENLPIRELIKGIKSIDEAKNFAILKNDLINLSKEYILKDLD